MKWRRLRGYYLEPTCPDDPYAFLFKAVAAPLLLKAKETSELSSETCAALQLCLELLSNQEEVSEQRRGLNHFPPSHHTQFHFLSTTEAFKLISY